MPIALDDIRIMEPLVRRALDPGVASASAASGYTADMIKDVTADAVSNIILCAGETFPWVLNVSSRNATTNFPEEFTVTPEMPYEVQVLVALQAAITATVAELNSLKTAESIRDEGSEWSYTKSAGVLRDKLKNLVADRNKQLENLRLANGRILEVFVNTLQERNESLDRAIEPWFYE